MTLGQRIQQIRATHGLSQEEFAEKLGTTRQTVSRWELDIAYPEIAKIVLISRIFSVTTDSILKYGITTFEADIEKFVCGVYRSPCAEIVETEKFSLVYYCNAEKSVLGTKLYAGFENKKRLVAVCERDQTEKSTKYAYSIDENTVISNCEDLPRLLGEKYDFNAKNTMRRTETFTVNDASEPLPTVKEAGIYKCLALWRMSDTYRASAEELFFYLCTDKTEYVFSIGVKDTNVYCGASYNTVFELGLFCGKQFFRIRNYKENSEKFCYFHCDFSCEAEDVKILAEQGELGKCVTTRNGILCCVKRYTNDEIVLEGVGGDEYAFRRNEKRTERFVKV
ncbi:MAG: helix-turn-helix transcriptional regulator [Clostridia bacterium]|nr:helix-turn-helix transcriptional regulator [Clostridia bacterium]